GLERSTEFVRRSTSILPGEPLSYMEAEAQLAAGRQSELLQAIVGRYEHAAVNADVMIVEGLAATADHPSLDALNGEIARALDCQVLLVATPQPNLQALDDRRELAAQPFGGTASPHVFGVVVNQLNAPTVEVVGATRTGIRLPDVTLDAETLKKSL